MQNSPRNLTLLQALPWKVNATPAPSKTTSSPTSFQSSISTTFPVTQTICNSVSLILSPFHSLPCRLADLLFLNCSKDESLLSLNRQRWAETMFLGEQNSRQKIFLRLVSFITYSPMGSVVGSKITDE